MVPPEDLEAAEVLAIGLGVVRRGQIQTPVAADKIMGMHMLAAGVAVPQEAVEMEVQPQQPVVVVALAIP